MIVSITTLVALSILCWFEHPRVHLSAQLRSYLRPADILGFRSRSSSLATSAWLLAMIEQGQLRVEHDDSETVTTTSFGQWSMQDRHEFEYVPGNTLSNGTICTVPVFTDSHPQFWIVDARHVRAPPNLPTLEEAWKIAVWMIQPDSHWWVVDREVGMNASPSPKRFQDFCWPAGGCTFVYDPRVRQQREEVRPGTLSYLVRQLLTGQLYVCKSEA